MRTPTFRVSFPNVFEPRSFNGGDPKYQITMVFDAEAQKTKAFKEMKTALQSALKEKFGDKAKAIWKNQRNPTIRPVSESDTLAADFPEDCVFIRATSKRKPQVIDRRGGKEIFREADFYPGCYAIAEVNAFAYDANGNKGCSFGLNALIKMEDGDPLGNVVDAEKAFGDLVEDAGSEDAGGDEPEQSDGDDW